MSTLHLNENGVRINIDGSMFSLLLEAIADAYNRTDLSKKKRTDYLLLRNEIIKNATNETKV